MSLLRFEKVPPKLQDLDQLIRWQMRKAAPFRIEDAQVSWQDAVRAPRRRARIPGHGGAPRRRRGYERVCDAAGVHAGLVDIASFNQINAVLGGARRSSGDWLLVNVAADYATLAVVRDDHVIFFRNRSTGGIGDLPDLVHQTAMYHEDRLGGGGFTRVVLAGAAVLGAEEAERFRRLLEERIGMAGRAARLPAGRRAARSDRGVARAARHAGAGGRHPAARPRGAAAAGSRSASEQVA